MEKAILINSLSQLRAVNKQYRRIYYGVEFCERLMPTPYDLSKVTDFILRNNLKLSLVTPYVTPRGLENAVALFDFLNSRRLQPEVIINDWGVLNVLRRKYKNLIPVLGRLLNKQKRGPTLITLLKERKNSSPVYLYDPKRRSIVYQNKLPKGIEYYYKTSNVLSMPIIQDFLYNLDIKRIELDNVGQGFLSDLPKGKISASVYVPFVYITTTFYCPSAGCEDNNTASLKLKPCHKECQKYIFKLRHPAMPKVIYLKGNTQFYKNRYLSINMLKRAGVNRVVYEPRVPS
ncbi:MAG: hypothetical protein WC469_00185 [Candidatus Omnitrophota bacterium]